MIWFLLGLLVYYLTVAVERALVAASPADVEYWRAADDAATARALVLIANRRGALAALLLTRILLKVLLAAGAAGMLLQSGPIYGWLVEQMAMKSVPARAGWTVVGGALSLALAAGLYAIRLADKRLLGRVRTVWLLPRLSRFASFWRAFFSPVIQREPQRPSLIAPDRAPSDDPAPEGPLAVESREMEMLKSIVQFRDATVRQIMQPRSKVVGLSTELGFEAVLDTVRSAGFSRFPVYYGDLDNVQGILYVRDLIEHLDEPDDFAWTTLARRDVLLAPETKPVSALLQEFKQHKRHMAIVIDEHGSNAGIIALEDILEEVTGDIRDEFDEENESGYRRIDALHYVFDGQTPLNDVCRIAGLPPGTFDEVRGDTDTVAGLVLELNGDIPAIGATIIWNGYTLTVAQATERRIEQLKLSLPAPPSDDFNEIL